MDAEIERIATAMKVASLWDNTLFVFAADNGGPPCEPQERPLRALSSLCVRGDLRKKFPGRLWLSCWRCPPDVANSNYPMRGGKWTIWCVDQRSAIHHSPHALINPRLELYSAALPSQPLTSQCCWAVECRQGGRYPPDRVCPRRRPACQGLHRAHASLRLGGHHCGRRGRRQAAAGWRAQARLVSLTTLDALCSIVAGQAGMLSATKSVRPQAEHVGDTDGQINRQRRP